MRWLVLLSVIPACASAPSAPPVESRDSPSAGAAWDALVEQLPGRWIATTAGGSVPVEFRVVAGQSTLLEIFGRPGRETVTAYHRDRGGVVATHYCAQGNQPRLRMQDGDAQHPRFVLADVTGQNPGESVMVELGFDLAPAGGFERFEVYRQPDGSLERTPWRYTPAPTP
jgi:hypothetical protein